jgi:membrane protein YdbS with pleckstrin-like domain
MAAIAIIVFHTLILRSDIRQLVGDDILIFNIPLFILLVVIKTVITIFVIIQWLNEYYEITTKDIVHRRGLILKKEERHLLQHIGSVSIEQGVFGRIFNFGTLKLFNWTKEKYVYLYLIHNPMKYLHIMEELLPDADKSKRTVREHILEPEEDSL